MTKICSIAGVIVFRFHFECGTDMNDESGATWLNKLRSARIVACVIVIIVGDGGPA